MIKAVLADLTIFNPAKHFMLQEAFPEIRVPLLGDRTQVYTLWGQATEDGNFRADFAMIPNVKAGEYVYWFDRTEPLV